MELDFTFNVKSSAFRGQAHCRCNVNYIQCYNNKWHLKVTFAPQFKFQSFFKHEMTDLPPFVFVKMEFGVLDEFMFSSLKELENFLKVTTHKATKRVVSVQSYPLLDKIGDGVVLIKYTNSKPEAYLW